MGKQARQLRGGVLWGGETRVTERKVTAQALWQACASHTQQTGVVWLRTQGGCHSEGPEWQSFDGQEGVGPHLQGVTGDY